MDYKEWRKGFDWNKLDPHFDPMEAAWKAAMQEAAKQCAEACEGIANDCDSWEGGAGEGRIAARLCADACKRRNPML